MSKTVLRGNFYGTKMLTLEKRKRSQINNLCSHFKKLEKAEKINSKQIKGRK